MRQPWVVGLLIGMVGMCPTAGMSAEHGGQEHGGTTTAATSKEHVGTASPAMTDEAVSQEPSVPATQAEPSAEDIRQAIRSYITEESENGAFTIYDEETDADRRLELVRVHERVGKTGDLYYSCTDMKDLDSGEMLDLDFDVEQADVQLEVVDERIHKVNDQARYTYDEHDNRVPVTATTP